jgi:hypothetical protein
VAQTKKKRQRKHRGTQGGGISTKPKGRPRNRAEARARAQQRRAGSGSGKNVKSRAPTRGIVPPTWGSAIRKGLVAGGLFFVILALLFKNPVGQSAALAAFMLVFYVPMGYLTDRFFYRRGLAKQQREKLARRGDGN